MRFIGMIRPFRSVRLWKRSTRMSSPVHPRNVLNQPFPVAALIRPQNQQEMSSCKEGAAVRLTREEMTWLDLTGDEK